MIVWAKLAPAKLAPAKLRKENTMYIPAWVLWVLFFTVPFILAALSDRD